MNYMTDTNDTTKETAMNTNVPRTGHPLVDAHVNELFRQSHQRAQAKGCRVGLRPRRRP